MENGKALTVVGAVVVESMLWGVSDSMVNAPSVANEVIVRVTEVSSSNP